MKIYFIYSKKHDAILDTGKGRLQAGYMSEIVARNQLDYYFKYYGKYFTIFTQWKGKMEFTHVYEDWEIKEMELI